MHILLEKGLIEVFEVIAQKYCQGEGRLKLNVKCLDFFKNSALVRFD
jgi:hypothetical protein